MIIAILIAAILIIINTQYFKDYLTQRIAQWLEQEIDYPIQLESADIAWLDEIGLNGLSLKDQEGNDMITIDRIVLDYAAIQLIVKQIPSIEEARLYRPNVQLIKLKSIGNLNFNEFIKAIQARFKPKKQKKSNLFNIQSIEIRNGTFGYYDQTKDSIRDKLDYYHFQIQEINLTAEHFSTNGADFSFHISSLTGIEPSFKKKIRSFESRFNYSTERIDLFDLEAKIGESYISDSISFLYESTLDFSDFNNKITLKGNLVNTIIKSKDLQMFAPGIKNIDDTWKINTQFIGTVNSLELKYSNIEFGNRSFLQGNFAFDGLPDFENTFMNFNIRDSKLFSADLEQYFPDPSLETLHKIGQATMSGSFIGFPNDFVANGNFNTSLGSFYSDINLKLKGSEESTYSGRVRTYSVNIGKLLGFEKMVGNISMEGKIEGKGLGIDNANLDIEADISRFEVSNYEYKNIKTNAHLTTKLFEGEISVNDKNLKMYVAGIADFENRTPIINLKTEIPYSNFQKLFNTELPGRLSTQAIFNFQGMDINNINGITILKNLDASYGNRKLTLDSLFIISTVDSNKRFFELNSPLANVLMNGDFSFTQLYDDLLNLYQEIQVFYKNDSIQSMKYYAQKDTTRKSQSDMFFKIDLPQADAVLSLLSQNNVHVDSGAFLTGNLKTGDTIIFDAELGFSSKIQNMLDINEVKSIIHIEKPFMNDDFNSTISISSKNQQILNLTETKNFQSKITWLDRKIHFSSFIEQATKPNDLYISGTLNLENDRYKVNLDSTMLNLHSRKWTTDIKNQVTFSNKDVVIDSLVLVSDSQFVKLNGKLSTVPEDVLNITFQDFYLDFFNPVLPSDINGKLNGNFSMRYFDIKNNLAGTIDVRDFRFAGTHFGDLVGSISWVNEQKAVNTDINFFKDSLKIINFQGDIFPVAKQNNLNLKATILPMNLKVVEPIFQEFASEFKGTASGIVAIKGNFDKPSYDGKIKLNEANFHVNYLNTDYHLTDYIYFREDMINFKNLKLFDTYNNKAIINGNILHTNFTKYEFDLFGNYSNFQLLNTDYEDNKYYYGEAFSSGTFSINGPLKDVTIWTETTSNDGTHLHIPLAAYEELEKSDYIIFESEEEEKEDSREQQKKLLEDTSSSYNVNLDFDMDINEKAYFEIIFDLKAGDIIRGRGNGNLNMDLNTKGDFNLTGDYTIEKGAYNFTILNLVNKEFDINKGSTISWNGDPYEGKLDIDAVYKQNASLKPIIDTLLNPGVYDQYPFLATKKYPVNVLLDLQGELLAPDINLDIEIQKGYPAVVEPSVNYFHSYIAANEQELNKQVFSLMILRQLSPIPTSAGSDTDNLNLGTSASNSIGELISNQLSYWVSQIDENLEIDIDLSSIDSDALNTFQLRLSYTFLDGRLRVTRDGDFTNYQNKASAASVAGEWTVEYMLTKDGKVKVKMFNKNNQNTILGTSQNNVNTSAGFSILFTEKFDSFKELLKKDKSKGKEKKEK